MIKIAITGPESCGKSILAKQLAAYSGTLWVPEYARFFLSVLHRPYREADLDTMANGQIGWEDATASLLRKQHPTAAAPLLFCDTDLIVYQVWAEEKYRRVSPHILRNIRERPYHLHLLCAPDIPWLPDPQRENPHDRDRLFERYEAILRERGLPYAVVSGLGDHRLSCALRAINAAGLM